MSKNLTSVDTESIGNLGQSIANDARSAAKDLKAAGVEAGQRVADSVRSTKKDLEPLFDQATETVADFGENVKVRFCDAMACTNDYVRGNPWKVAGVAVAVGLLAGIFASSRRRY